MFDLLSLELLSACATPKEKDACHLIEHPNIDLTLKSMDDYAAMNWEAHRASYTEDGSVHMNSLDPYKLKGGLTNQLKVEKSKAKQAHGQNSFGM